MTKRKEAVHDDKVELQFFFIHIYSNTPNKTEKDFCVVLYWDYKYWREPLGSS